MKWTAKLSAKWSRSTKKQENWKPARETPLPGVIQPERKFEFFGISETEMRTSEEVEATDRHKSGQFMNFMENALGNEDPCRNTEV